MGKITAVSGTKIKNILNMKRMTQVDLFDAIKKRYPKHYLGKDTINKICTDQRDCTTITLIKITEALGVTPNDIIDYKIPLSAKSASE